MKEDDWNVFFYRWRCRFLLSFQFHRFDLFEWNSLLTRRISDWCFQSFLIRTDFVHLIGICRMFTQLFNKCFLRNATSEGYRFESSFEGSLIPSLSLSLPVELLSIVWRKAKVKIEFLFVLSMKCVLKESLSSTIIDRTKDGQLFFPQFNEKFPWTILRLMWEKIWTVFVFRLMIEHWIDKSPKISSMKSMPNNQRISPQLILPSMHLKHLHIQLCKSLIECFLEDLSKIEHKENVPNEDFPFSWWHFSLNWLFSLVFNELFIEHEHRIWSSTETKNFVKIWKRNEHNYLLNEHFRTKWTKFVSVTMSFLSGRWRKRDIRWSEDLSFQRSWRRDSIFR